MEARSRRSGCLKLPRTRRSRSRRRGARRSTPPARARAAAAPTSLRPETRHSWTRRPLRAAHESRRDRAFEKNLPWESARALLVEAFCPSQIKWSDAERAKNERFARVMSGGMRDYEGWEEVRAFKTVRKLNAGASPRHRRDASSTAYLRTGSRPNSSRTSTKTTTSWK